MAGQRDLGRDERAAHHRAVDQEPSVEGLEPVAQADQTPSVRPGAAGTVVSYGDAQGPVLDAHADLRALRTGVLDDVRQRLGHDEVGGRLHHGRQPADRHIGGDRQRHPRHEHLHARAQAAGPERRGQDPLRQVAQLVVRPSRVFERLGQERLRSLVTLLMRPRRELQRDDRVHESLLRPVVEVTDDTPALLVGGRHDARAGRGDLRAAVGVRDRRGDEIGEAGEPPLGARRQRLGALRRGDDAPKTVLDDDRGADAPSLRIALPASATAAATVSSVAPDPSGDEPRTAVEPSDSQRTTLAEAASNNARTS